MSEPTPYPRFPSEDDVPDGWGRAPEPAPGAPVAAGSSTPRPGTPEPLGVLTRLTVAFAVLYTLLQLPRYWLARDAEERWLDARVANRSPEEFFTPYELVDLVGTLVLLGAFVVTCLWLWRARVNVEVLSPHSPQARSRAWVWGGWLVPVVNLWFPYQVVRDVLRVRASSRGGSRVGWWWGVLLTTQLAVGVEMAFVPVDVVDPDLVSAVPVLAVVTSALTVATCGLWIRVVRAVAADQAELLAGRA